MKAKLKNPRSVIFFIFILFVICTKSQTFAEESKKLVFLHYWTGDMSGGINEMVNTFNKKNPGYEVKAAGFEHETFKPSIKVMLEVGNPPDFFSFWAGAKTQDLVNSGYLLPIDDVWKKADLASRFSPAITGACTYNGKIYAIPVTQHFVAFFYNKAIFKMFNLMPPRTWQEFLALCDVLKEKKITPISLGSREKWPAQFWFDYLLLRTAGPEFRQQLMDGKVSYNDPKVAEVFSVWNKMLSKQYFNTTPNVFDWSEASKMVYNGEAAMTLMGTWITGLFESKLNWKQEKDFDYFSFPVMKPEIPNVSLGPVDCILLPNSKNSEAAKTALEFFSDKEPQKEMSRGSGALAPNANIPDSFYPAMQARIRQTINQSKLWAFNYDLATQPEVAEIGLDCFAKFLNTPEKYNELLRETDNKAKEFFHKGR